MSLGTGKGDATVRFSALAIDGLRLAVPQSDVRTLESAADVEQQPAALGPLGWFVQGPRRVPVYCADANLAPLRQVDRGRRICVILAGPRGDFGVLCDEFYPVAQPQPPLPVPRAARASGSPIRGVFERDQHMYCVSSAAALAAHFGVSPGNAEVQ